MKKPCGKSTYHIRAPTVNIKIVTQHQRQQVIYPKHNNHRDDKQQLHRRETDLTLTADVVADQITRAE